MKKCVFFSLLFAIACIMTTGCSSCKSENPKQDVPQQEQVVYDSDYDGVLPDFTKGADHIIALQRQEMFNAVNGGYYVWYETKFTFNDSIKDTTLDEIKLVEITSTFQTFAPNLSWTITDNVAKGHLFPHPTPGTWIEDFDMSDAEIKLTIEDVIERLKAWDGIMPPAMCFYLRKPVGPVPCNAQYVAGNPMQVIFIDAVTGDITDWNPAFKKDLEKPLGEWP